MELHLTEKLITRYQGCLLSIVGPDNKEITTICIDASQRNTLDKQYFEINIDKRIPDADIIDVARHKNIARIRNNRFIGNAVEHAA